MTTLDVRDACLHVPIQAFLRFVVVTQKGTLQFRVLPFGLAASPRLFTKILTEAVAYLHLQGTAAQVEADTQRAVLVLQKLGWLVSVKKSSLEPALFQNYLGYRVDSRAQKLFLPGKMVESRSCLKSDRRTCVFQERYSQGPGTHVG